MSCEGEKLLSQCQANKSSFYDTENLAECLEGVSLINPGLVHLKDCNSILCRDSLETTNKVRIISGGAYGNDHAYAGYVGRGMLTAAVFGSLKSAPTVFSIIQIIRYLGAGHCPGILLIVQNRPGYVLNFNIAKERALKLGIKVRILIVEDEAKFANFCKTHGSLGTLFVQKIAGSMVEEGKSLDEIVYFCQTFVHPRLKSLAIRKIPTDCSNGPLTTIEIGTEQAELFSYKNLVAKVLDLLTVPDKFDNTEKNYVLMINNLGGFSGLEINILAKSLILGLQNLGFSISRTYAGHLMTSMTTEGFQISLLQISHPEILKYLDAPTQAPSWPRNLLRSNFSNFPVFKTTDYFEPSLSETKMSLDSADAFLNILLFACEGLIACADQIDIIDRETGDGNCGSSLKKGAEVLKQAIEDKIIDPVNATDPAQTFQKIQQIIEKNVNGLQGGIYSIFFEAISNYFGRIQKTTLNLTLWAEAFSEAIRAISEKTGVSKGDRTMLDSLIAAYEALVESMEKHKSDLESIGEAVSAAENKAIETVSMNFKFNQGFQSQQKFKYPDAGAHAVGVWMRAMFEGIKLKLFCNKVNLKSQDVEFITIS